MSRTLRHRRLLPFSLALAIGAPGGAATFGQAVLEAAPDTRADTYPYLGTLSLPVAGGLREKVYDWGCRGGRIPDIVLRWDCAGSRNTYLLGHASSVFDPVAQAYRSGRLRAGKLATWTRDGVTRTFKVRWVRLVREDYVWKGRTGDEWAWNATNQESITLQTCWGADSDRRLIVRMILIE